MAPDDFTKKLPTLYLSIVIDGSTEAVVSATALIGFCFCCSSSASNSASKSGPTKLSKVAISRRVFLITLHFQKNPLVL